jgi:WD40 repeat protein
VSQPMPCGKTFSRAHFSGDGRRLLTIAADGMAIAPSTPENAIIQVWDVATRRPLMPPITIKERLRDAKLSADGSRFVCTVLDGPKALLQVWDVDTAKPMGPPFVGSRLNEPQEVDFSPDGRQVLTVAQPQMGGRGDPSRLWDVKTSQPGVSFSIPGDARFDLRGTAGMSSQQLAAFDSQGGRLVLAEGGTTAQIFDARTGAAIGAPLQHMERINYVTFSADGRLVATASDDRTARVWRAADGEPVTPALLHNERATYAAFSPDSTRVVTSGADQMVRLWDAATGEPVVPPVSFGQQAAQVQIGPDGSRVTAAMFHGVVRTWRFPADDRPKPDLLRLATLLSGRKIDALGGLASASFQEVRDAWLDLRGRYSPPFLPFEPRTVLATGPKPSEPRAIHAAAPAEPSPERRPPTNERTRTVDGEHVYRAAFAPDGKTYATGGDRNTIRLFDAASGSLVRPISQPAWVQALAFSADSKRIFTVGFHKGLYTWDAATGRELDRIEVPELSNLEHAVWSPDGRLAIGAHSDGNLALWDLPAKKKLHGLPSTWDAGYAFTPDGQDVVIQTYTKAPGHYTVQGIEALSDRPKWSVRLNGIHSPVNGCWCRTATGELVTVYDDGTVVACALADGKELRRMSLKVARLRDRCSALSPDGRRLLTGHVDHRVRLWNLADGSACHEFVLEREPTGPPAFSPDGRFAVAHSFRGMQYFWHLPESEPANRADSRRDATRKP